MEDGTVPHGFPCFGLVDHSDEGELDFAMLSEYLMLEDDQCFLEGSDQGISGTDAHNIRDLQTDEDQSSGMHKKQKVQSESTLDDLALRRRERNRILAKKTRLRKKFFFESLKSQIVSLEEENKKLRAIAENNLPKEVCERLLSQRLRVDPSTIPTASSDSASSHLDKSDASLIRAIFTAQRSFVITDPSLPDNPITFASKGFLEMCGYKASEVLGRNCRFLQGPKTDRKTVDVLKKGIAEGKDTSVCLVNYRADGSEFFNQIFVAPLRNIDNEIINYVGVQVEIKRSDTGNDETR